MKKYFNKKIIYSNYKRNNKWLGLIEYKSIVFLLIFSFLVINIVKNLNINTLYKIYIDLFIIIPIVGITVINFECENVLNIIFYIFRYYTIKKIYYFDEYKISIYKKEYINLDINVKKH